MFLKSCKTEIAKINLQDAPHIGFAAYLLWDHASHDYFEKCVIFKA